LAWNTPTEVTSTFIYNRIEPQIIVWRALCSDHERSFYTYSSTCTSGPPDIWLSRLCLRLLAGQPPCAQKRSSSSREVRPSRGRKAGIASHPFSTPLKPFQSRRQGYIWKHAIFGRQNTTARTKAPLSTHWTCPHQGLRKRCWSRNHRVIIQ